MIRFSRRFLIALSALFSAAVFGAAWLALEGRSVRPRHEAPASGGAAVPPAGAAPPGLAPGRDPGARQRKLEFLNGPADDEIYNLHALQQPASPHQVMAGTVIAASLVTGLNSDLPGLVTAQVTKNVYDSVTGHALLVPQGARLIGRYHSAIAHGQSRALVVWQRLVMPNGRSIVLDNLPATDTAGYAGLEDEVDVHGWEFAKGVVLSTLLGVGTELTFGDACARSLCRAAADRERTLGAETDSFSVGHAGTTAGAFSALSSHASLPGADNLRMLAGQSRGWR